MPDQLTTPPKPKPGSLRDRIAAFEKPTASGAALCPAPAPRPKPGGISWKPKVPSPPSSPSSSDHTERKVAGGMSASDAKESIGKGGSLKERMAALQNRGGFGAPPPPVSPKPALEKPKWKPPPVITPVDKDDDEEPPRGESSKSPPPPPAAKSAGDESVKDAVDEEPATAPAESGDHAEADPEDEERQRRAAIAARMARLGGARVGMAPMFAPKPAVKKHEPIEEPPKPKPTSDEEDILPKEPTAEAAALPTVTTTEEQSSVSTDLSSEKPPASKKSESTTSLSLDSDQSQQSRSPGSMPLPSAPRRAAPPRKKAVKSTSLEQPPADVLEEKITDTVPELDIAEASDVAAIAAESAEKAVKAEKDDVQQDVADIGATEKDAEYPAVVSAVEPEHATAAEPTTVFTTNSGQTEVTPEESSDEDRPTEVKESTKKATEDEQEFIEPRKSIYVAAPTHATNISEDDAVDEDEAKDVEPQEPKEELKAPVKKSPTVVAEETREEPVAQDSDEPDEDEEAARHKRVADKLAKMGGINPFALPPQPQRKPSVSSDDAHTSTISPRSSISKEPSVDSPPPPPPQRRESTRKSSVGSTVVRDVSSRSHVEPKARSPTISQSPQVSARKSSLDFDSVPAPAELATNPLSKRKSQDDNGLVGPSRGSAASVPVTSAAGILAETEEPSDVEEEELLSNAEAEPEHSKTTYEFTPEPTDTTEEEPVRTNELVEDLEEVIEVAPPVLSSLPPPVPKGTRPVSISVPVDPALPTDPVPIPSRPAQPHPQHCTMSPARSLPPPPPPRLVPQSEEEEEDGTSEHEEEAAELGLPKRQQQYVEKDEYKYEERGGDEEPLRRLPPRSVSTDDEASPLPVQNRRSFQVSADSGTHSARPHRSLPPPPPISIPISDVEQDSDFDEVLPTPPRRRRPMTPATSTTPVTNEIPLIVPPPHSEDGGTKKVDPSPLYQSSYPVHVPAPGSSGSAGEASPSHLSPTFSVSEQEILDEEEGDPIDPSFHSPSRRASAATLPPTSPPPQPQEPAPETEEEDEQQARRRTIAARMAKLGGIKFGAAPSPASMRPTPPQPKVEEETTAIASETEGEHVEASEEEEERARKERIAAKLAGMGGMRIGMLPLGVGSLRPQLSHVLTEEAPPPKSPAHAAPLAHPPPRPQQSHDSDADHESSLSASQHSMSTTSEDGVKVEAEESEIEEVSHEDAAEELEEVPPPIPDRGVRRRGTGSESETVYSPTVPSHRPPVPTTVPNRRSSTQTMTSVRKSSTETSGSVLRSQTHKPQSEYVMVEEPSGFTSDDTPPPLPPARPTSRAPPPRGVPPPPPPATEPSDSSLTHWEFPAVPSTSLTFGATPDLSLSWTEEQADAPGDSSPPPPLPEKPTYHPPHPTAEHHLSPDELIAVWGRVGVQVCEVATSLFEKSKRALVGDGTYAGFVNAVLSEVPNADLSSYGHVIYVQSGTAVQKRASEIMPGDIVVLQDAKLKGHKGIHVYHQNVGAGEDLVGVVSEFEAKKSKIRVFQANQHVGQQTVEAASYRLEDLKSGTVKIYRVLENK